MLISAWTLTPAVIMGCLHGALWMSTLLLVLFVFLIRFPAGTRRSAWAGPALEGENGLQQNGGFTGLEITRMDAETADVGVERRTGPANEVSQNPRTSSGAPGLQQPSRVLLCLWFSFSSSSCSRTYRRNQKVLGPDDFYSL